MNRNAHPASPIAWSKTIAERPTDEIRQNLCPVWNLVEPCWVKARRVALPRCPAVPRFGECTSNETGQIFHLVRYSADFSRIGVQRVARPYCLAPSFAELLRTKIGRYLPSSVCGSRRTLIVGYSRMNVICLPSFFARILGVHLTWNSVKKAKCLPSFR